MSFRAQRGIHLSQMDSSAVGIGIRMTNLSILTQFWHTKGEPNE